MIRRLAPALLLAALAGLAACGQPTGVLLSIESTRTVPDEIDGLMVRVEGGAAGATSERLQITEAFPHSLAVVVDDGTPQVVIEVTALHGNVAVTASRVTVDLADGVLRPYTLAL